MATLIYASNSSGCTGKCDANCYDATSFECHCICRGMNHGKGLARAQDNTKEYAEEWIKQYKKENPDAKEFGFGEDVFQMKLL